MYTFYLPSGEIIEIAPDKPVNKFDVASLVCMISKESRFYNLVDWSVLEHSLACYYAGQSLHGDNPSLVKYLLFHDIHEALIRDVPSFLKGKDYSEMEKLVQSKILERLNIEIPTGENYEAFKIIDDLMAFIESHNLSPNYRLSEQLSDRILKTYIGKPEYTETLLECQSAFNLVSAFNLWKPAEPTSEEDTEPSSGKPELNSSVFSIFDHVLASY